MLKNLVEEYVMCNLCKGDVTFELDQAKCVNCGLSYRYDGDIFYMNDENTKDIILSIEKWDSLYKKQLDDESFRNLYSDYKKDHLEMTLMQIEEAKSINSNTVYLEIGCGQFFIGNEIAHKSKLVIGIDFCPSALKIASKLLKEKGISNYLLIQGNILNLPIKSEKIDVIYGGGVIEHFIETQKCIDELYRVLNVGGLSFNTVPVLNIASLTYRQIWGNIPNVPIIRQIAEFIHIKLLGGKHLIFGYEMSFLKSSISKIHKKAGFKKVKVDKFEVKLEFAFIPAFIRPPFIWLAKNSSLFWPMIKIVAIK